MACARTAEVDLCHAAKDHHREDKLGIEQGHALARRLGEELGARHRQPDEHRAEGGEHHHSHFVQHARRHLRVHGCGERSLGAFMQFDDARSEESRPFTAYHRYTRAGRTASLWLSSGAARAEAGRRTKSWRLRRIVLGRGRAPWKCRCHSRQQRRRTAPALPIGWRVCWRVAACLRSTQLWTPSATVAVLGARHAHVA